MPATTYHRTHIRFTTQQDSESAASVSALFSGVDLQSAIDYDQNGLLNAPSGFGLVPTTLGRSPLTRGEQSLVWVHTRCTLYTMSHLRRAATLTRRYPRTNPLAFCLNSSSITLPIHSLTILFLCTLFRPPLPSHQSPSPPPSPFSALASSGCLPTLGDRRIGELFVPPTAQEGRGNFDVRPRRID